MNFAPEPKYPELLEDQILNIAVYGETVAAYRYMVLSEKVPELSDKKAFADIADEEHCHKQKIEALLDKYYPDSLFYLSEEDGALVVAGPRLIDVRDIEDYREVIKLTLDTELKTAQFYKAMSPRLRTPEIQQVFSQMAEDSFDHHRRLTEVAKQRGFFTTD